jgi:deoxyribonuclease (pyrimidine dimer)
MTRINAGIPPAKLTDKHLIAEHREITRIPRAVAKGKYSMSGVPDQFTLGTGHVKFFYNKLQYLLDRYHQIYQECIRRGFNVQNWSSAWEGVPPEMMGRWEPDSRSIEIIEARIRERLETRGGAKTPG